MPRRKGISQTLNYRADQAGLVAATTAVPLSFQRTLMSRSSLDQGLITGLSYAFNYAAVTLVQESIQAASLAWVGRSPQTRGDERSWHRATIAADLAGIAAGAAVQRMFSQQSDEQLPRAGARTAGWYLSVASAFGAAVGAAQQGLGRFDDNRPGRGKVMVPVFVPLAGALAGGGEYLRRKRARLDADLPPDEEEIALGKAIAMSAGVAAGSAAMSLVERRFADLISRTLSERIGGPEALWRPLAHAVALGAIGTGVRKLMSRAFAMIESKEESVEFAFDLPPINPLLSGSLQSLVPFDTMSKQGRRYVWSVTHPTMMREVLQEDDVIMPVRVYVGLESAPTESERVDLVMRELERTGAFDRKWLLVASPTGTGYVNYAAAAALELLTRGNCATVAMQYAARPSPLSLDRVEQGRRQNGLLFRAIHERLKKVPEGERPTVVLFGESLGAWSSQDPFIGHGTQGLVDLGIDYAIWIGTPHFSEWKEQVLRDHRADVLPEILGVFNDIGEWNALDDERRKRIRYVMITHYNDGVALFGPGLAIQSPAWLSSDERPPSVPKGMRWAPTTTFFQVLVDMKNAARVIPGKFEAKGHDYRADLLPFFQSVLGLSATDEQMERIREHLEWAELRRSRWINERKGADNSMASALLVDFMKEHPDEIEAILAPRLRKLAQEALGAEGAGHTS